ncbi:response regulator transcription factor [Hydrogenophaga laconesensis]|uniref:DNA-binding NarL/FixJ family response regulator n=1 Tax=Hydrogenophaga laconesensis TaxID=1805971 RepID=A0ABU1V5Q7_9BURK|nr:response regulator transcription factor [Hydrogenophaga laconesensis]MDR7092779.1 DNA-binding NarL/FixJ family response regulator [Hydrogenophaga laconesensis]
MPEQQPPRTILAVDDHELVRMGLRQVIVQRFADRFEVAEAAGLEQALQFLQQRAADVLLLLLDLNLGDTRGLTGLQLLRQLYPRLPVVVVSGTNDPRVREEALAQGAMGYFCKTGDTADLSGLLDTVEKAATPTPARAPGAAPPPASPHDTLARSTRLRPGIRLTSRQIQVLELILGGLDNQSIARETGLALGSVKNCVSTIFLDFNVRSRAELIRLFS